MNECVGDKVVKTVEKWAWKIARWQYPGIKLWLHLKRKHYFDYNVPSDHIMITFEKKTAQKPVGSLWKKTLVSFTILFTMYPLQICATHWEFFPKILCNVIIMYPTIYSKSSLRVYGKTETQCDFFAKEPLGTLRLHCRVFYERTLNEWHRFGVDTLWTKLWKKPGFSFTKNPLVFVLFSFQM